MCDGINPGENVGVIHSVDKLSPMMWDFVEAIPFAEHCGGLAGALEWIARVLERTQAAGGISGHARRHRDTHPLPMTPLQASDHDPPYYDAVPYAYLSDFFYVWLKRALLRIHADLFAILVPKDETRLFSWPTACNLAIQDATIAFESEMKLRLWRKVGGCFEPSGIGVSRLRHKSTAGWEALLDKP